MIIPDFDFITTLLNISADQIEIASCRFIKRECGLLHIPEG